MFGKKEKGEGGDGMVMDNKRAEEEEALKENLKGVKTKLIVLSGKGGVGKSTVSVNVAVALAKEGKKVGLMDIDIHGPSVPKLLGLEGERLTGDQWGKIFPVQYKENLKVMSVGFLLGKAEDAVIWRGPMKYGAIKQFAKDVDWGELDYLIVDSPPGTGDEPLSVCQIIKPDGGIVVTTPQDVSTADVRRSISFCRSLNLPVVGVIENMSGFICPHCNNEVNIFKKGGGRKMAEEMDVPFLGSVPIEVRIMEDGDAGKPFMDTDEKGETPSGSAFKDIVKSIIKNKEGVEA